MCVHVYACECAHVHVHVCAHVHVHVCVRVVWRWSALPALSTMRDALNVLIAVHICGQSSRISASAATLSCMLRAIAAVSRRSIAASSEK